VCSSFVIILPLLSDGAIRAKTLCANYENSSGKLSVQREVDDSLYASYVIILPLFSDDANRAKTLCANYDNPQVSYQFSTTLRIPYTHHILSSYPYFQMAPCRKTHLIVCRFVNLGKVTLDGHVSLPMMVET
jgi:hypothetical protein